MKTLKMLFKQDKEVFVVSSEVSKFVGGYGIKK